MLRSSLNRSLKAVGARSASAQTAVIQEDESRESVACATSLTGWGAPNAAGPQNERKLSTIRSPARVTEATVAAA
jgi:hypothetical protein